MSLQMPFVITGIILAFVTILNYQNWGTTHNEQWYWLSWTTLIMSMIFIGVSFFIDNKPNHITQKESTK